MADDDSSTVVDTSTLPTADKSAGKPDPYQQGWKRMLTPLLTAATVYGGARISGADAKTAAAAAALGGMMRVPSIRQGPLGSAMETFTGGRQPAQATPARGTTQPNSDLAARVAALEARGSMPAPSTGGQPGGTPPAGGQQAAAGPLGAPGSTPPTGQPTDPNAWWLPGFIPNAPWAQPVGAPSPASGPVKPGMAGGGLTGSRMGQGKGIPNPSKGLHLKNPAGVKLGSLGDLMKGPAFDPSKTLRHSDQSPSRLLGRAAGMKSVGLAAGGPVQSQDQAVAPVKASDWFFQHYGIRDVPKQENGILQDVADKGQENVRINLKGAEMAKKKEEKKDEKLGLAHGGPIRGKMSQAMGGPPVPGADMENPLPGKKAPMKFAKGGAIGGKSKVVGAGAVVRGVRPAKKY